MDLSQAVVVCLYITPPPLLQCCGCYGYQPLGLLRNRDVLGGAPAHFIVSLFMMSLNRTLTSHMTGSGHQASTCGPNSTTSCGSHPWSLLGPLCPMFSLNGPTSIWFMTAERMMGNENRMKEKQREEEHTRGEEEMRGEERRKRKKRWGGNERGGEEETRGEERRGGGNKRRGKQETREERWSLSPPPVGCHHWKPLRRCLATAAAEPVCSWMTARCCYMYYIYTWTYILETHCGVLWLAPEAAGCTDDHDDDEDTSHVHTHFSLCPRLKFEQIQWIQSAVPVTSQSSRLLLGVPTASWNKDNRFISCLITDQRQDQPAEGLPELKLLHRCSIAPWCPFLLISLVYWLVNRLH